MAILVVYEEERIRMISIYQINTTREMSKAFNAADGEAGVVPALDAKRALMMLGSKNWDSKFWDFFELVYDVEVLDLEEAFEMTNLWENRDLVKTYGLGKGHSSSVGDIFVNQTTGEVHMVDNFGFAYLGQFAEFLEKSA